MANDTKSTKTNAKSTNTQSIVIAVLVTILVCAGILFAILAGTGVIKFGGGTNDDATTSSTQQNPSSDTTNKIIQNTHPKVAVRDATLAKVQDLEFYLPDDFTAGDKNDSGAYTYNLTDGGGWAQALVYVEKTNLTPEQYLAKISSYLEVTDKNYQMNGTHWVQAENANSLAYATELDGTIYAVYYNVKLDSDDTAEAMSMIPKTLHMDRIYSNN